MDTKSNSKSVRVDYLRFMLRLLQKKYFVVLSSVTKELGFQPNYLRDFANGSRMISVERMDQIEQFLWDLYGGLLADEFPTEPKDFHKYVNRLSGTLVFQEYVPKGTEDFIRRQNK